MTIAEISVPTVDGMHANIPEGDYHADRHSLSSTGARKLLESPRKYQWSLDQPAQTARHFDVGHYVHTLVLGVGSPVVVIDAEDFRTKAAREDRDAAHAEGKVPLLKADADLCREMADALLTDPYAQALFESGLAEQSIYWTEGDVRMRGRLDWLKTFDDGTVPLVGDVKTTAGSANPREWRSTAAKYQLHFQAAWYTRAVVKAGIGEGADFLFLNIEKEPPHLVSITELDARAMEHAHRRVELAIQLYAEYSATDTWPNWVGVTPGIHTVGLPEWLYKQEEITL